MKLQGICLTLGLLGTIGAGAACAQDAGWSTHPALTDRWTLQLGAYVPKVDTMARLDSSTRAIGTQLSFEDDLGFDDRKVTPALPHRSSTPTSTGCRPATRS